MVDDPIWLSKADVLTEKTEAQIIGHNEAWEAICGKGE